MNVEQKIKKSDLILLLLYFDNKKTIDGITKMEKLVFVTQKEVLDKWKEIESSKFDFGPDRFGPLSTEVYDELDFLKSVQMVGEEGKTYSLTDKGQRFIEQKVFSRIPEKIRKDIEIVKTQHGRESLNDLLKYVYTNYPDYTVKSEIRERVLG